MISVITPVYNGRRFIEFCIQNVIEQNCADMEHIIIDGGSTDGTVEVITTYARQYPHIRWVSEKDRGQSDAMNKGIALALGSIISFLNVDDYYEPGVLARVLDLFKKFSEPTLLVGNCKVWDDDGKLQFISKPRLISLSNILLKRILDAHPMNPSAYFYHRSLHELIGPYKVEEHYGLDLDFIIRALQAANVVYRDETWGNWRNIRGTKTYELEMSGKNLDCVSKIVSEHMSKLPVYRRTLIRAQGKLSGGYAVMRSAIGKLVRPMLNRR